MNENFEAVNTTPDKGMAMMAMYRGSRLDFREYRKFETLPREAWEYIDNQLIRTAKENLVGIADLNMTPSTNMTYDGMASSVYTRKRISEIGSATNSVSPDAASGSARIAMDDLSVPMVVTYKDFNINTHEMAMATRTGLPLGFTLVEEATRSVARKLEDNLFNGSFTASSASTYGYTTFPQRQQYTISTSWATAVPKEIMDDVNAMMSLSMQANHFGPWMLYIPWQYQVRLNQDYLTGSTADFPVSGSIRNRLLNLPGLLGIRVSSFLANENAVLVEMTSDTVVLINGMPIRAVAWEPPGTPNWDHKFKVLAISVPMLIADYKGQCGIIHASV